MHLPSEVFHQILKYVDGDYKTLSSLRRVDKETSELVTPEFWNVNTVKIVKGVARSVDQMRSIIDTGLHQHVKSITITSTSFWPQWMADNVVFNRMSLSRAEEAQPLYPCGEKQGPFDPNSRNFRQQSRLYMSTIIELLRTCKNLNKLTIRSRQFSSNINQPRGKRQDCWSTFFVAKIFPVIAQSNISEILLHGADEGSFKRVFGQELLLRGRGRRGRGRRRLMAFPNLKSLGIRICERPDFSKNDTAEMDTIRKDTKTYFFERGLGPKIQDPNDVAFNQTFSMHRSGGIYGFTYRRK
ncbi:hypothetical protein TWF481_012106 [Arthrobotrys musiformis]|uniref:F-box domain-containing protein n=1 Tax=Arthrobotrys musiformis TaxID=47236 RepID=A0AAV9VY14_9PEZI